MARLRHKPVFNPDGTPLSGMDVIRTIQDETDTVLMSFSRGKDSIAAWLTIRPYFKRIVPYHLWGVPTWNLSRIVCDTSRTTSRRTLSACRIPHSGGS